MASQDVSILPVITSVAKHIMAGSPVDVDSLTMLWVAAEAHGDDNGSWQKMQMQVGDEWYDLPCELHCSAASAGTDITSTNTRWIGQGAAQPDEGPETSARFNHVPSDFIRWAAGAATNANTESYKALGVGK